MNNLSLNFDSSVTSLGNVYGHRKCRKIDLFNDAANGRIQNQKDQVYINALLSNAVRKEKNVMNELKDLNDKISIREKVIKSIEAEAKELRTPMAGKMGILDQNRSTQKQKSVCIRS